MGKWGLAIRIELVLLVCTAAVLVLVGLQANGARAANQQNINALSNIQTSQLQLRDIQLDVQRLIGAWKSVLLGRDEASTAGYRGAFHEQKDLLMSRIRDLQARSLEAPSPNELQGFLDTVIQLTGRYETAMQDFQPGSHRDAVQMQRGVGDLDTKAVAQIDAMVDDLAVELQELQSAQAQMRHEGNRRFVFTLVAILLGVSTVFWVFMRWHVIRPLKGLVDAAFRLSEDETDVSIRHCDRSDELGALANALHVFKRNRISELALIRATELSTVEREQQIKQEFEYRRDAEGAELRDREKQQVQQQADDSAASEQLLQLRIDRLSMGVSAAAAGDLSYLAKHPCENLHLNDALAHMTRELESLFAQFGQDFGKIRLDARNVTLSAVQLEELGQSIDEGAQLNSTQTQQVLKGAQAVRDVLLNVAERVDDMEAGIRGISGHASQASTVASQAVELARKTDGTMRTLSESSQDIGNVIKLINSVAEQTNLLALNATIEAARAGDAGKGFAVVANEVKELAKETNKATDEIQARIAAIRNDTDHAVEAIASINQIVSEIDGLQTSISESVLVQSETAQNITRLVGDATGDNKNVRSILADVVERQEGNREAAAKVRQSSEELRSSAEGNVKLTARYRI